ncbi:hypothetical protein HYPBUDRAFT_110443 [Hyphopichia burtonii NRRL Y-1933]|uniref:Dol-P-Glc:Glc(2)Man(9)GlcNAc(2)-PP-Dol alpha-1,2-glucosyltransferase n=1 Tax=Hyphopichia burtonii NRRL Y-1933 TaxID=984485 RepID=A0A1E4RGR1_9ASCO|nr:hypothetical protein HYPBUDRAFT_110443 [Hyphopichia burtonii NRRL Y-1933]ODV66454.1 hypothetical protein HYPBUDRAFT_110443 [Hyphopichia burtonii NRRL Y-1933]
MGNLQYILVSFLILTSAIIYRLVALRVTEPFIDEIFHLRQCQTYCDYRFDEWDNKITTPPGLYLLGFAYTNLIRVIGMNSSSLDAICADKNILRSLNLVGGLVAFPFFLWLLKKNSNYSFWILNVITIPLIFPYYFLFYTDVWASILILASLVLGVTPVFKDLHVNIALSGILAFVSLWFRQTNIIWIAFVMSLVIGERSKTDGSIVGNFVSFVKQFFNDWYLTLPYFANIVLFAIFIKKNGGVAFGDKDNHTIGLHLVQVFYCFTFIIGLSLPLWLSVNHLKKYARFTVLGNYGLNLVITVISFTLIKYIIDNYTIVHPFLLADNRHYTFYIYRKVLKHPMSFIVTVPLYHFSLWSIVEILNSSGLLNPMNIITFVAGTILTIIPSPLFEPRYYIVPFIFFRIFSKPQQDSSQLFEFYWNMLINSILFFVFFSYEFKWASEGDLIQRIIW